MTTHWPDFPYRPFIPFGLEDAAIFPGRASDVRKCMQAFGDGLTKLLVVHGQAGVGKSSLLQAGLCPHFKQHGYLFPEDNHKLRVASMEHYPLDEICKVVFTICTATFKTTAPDGHTFEHSALPAREFASLGDFAHAARADPTLLARWLAAKARHSSKTIVLLLDHVEALFEPDVPDEHRGCVLDALKYILNTPMDLKCVLSIRSERVGDLQDALRSLHNDAAVRWHLLKPMSRAALQQLVVAPSRMRRHHGVSAIERYTVFFDPELPGTIAEDIDRNVPVPEAMATAQLICAHLYRQALGNKQHDVVAAVESQSYRTLGPAQGSIERYVLQQLRAMAHDLSIPLEERDKFIAGWIHVMAEMAEPGLDGMIKSRSLRAGELELFARKNGIDADINLALAWLQASSHRLLRMHRPAIGWTPGSDTVDSNIHFSLSHSSLARPIAALSLNADRAAPHRNGHARDKWAMIPARRLFVLYGALIVTILTSLIVNDAVRWWMLIGGLLASIAMVMWTLGERQKASKMRDVDTQARRKRLAIALSPRTWVPWPYPRTSDITARPMRGLSYGTAYSPGLEEEAQSKLGSMSMESDGSDA